MQSLNKTLSQLLIDFLDNSFVLPFQSVQEVSFCLNSVH